MVKMAGVKRSDANQMAPPTNLRVSAILFVVFLRPNGQLQHEEPLKLRLPPTTGKHENALFVEQHMDDSANATGQK